MLPTDRFAAVLMAGGLMLGFSGRFAPLMTAGVALVVLAIALAASDWVKLARLGTPEVSRTADEKLSVGAKNLVTLSVRNSSFSRLIGQLRDEFPDDFIPAEAHEPEDASKSSFRRGIFPQAAMLRGTRPPETLLDVDVAPRSETELTYHVIPRQRGDFEFGDAYMRLRGPFGMLARQIKFAIARPVKVYPNILDLRRYEISLRRERVVQPGQKTTRVRGRGTDFESLRDYMPDDEFRAIDWKASARRGKMTSRQYQEEKSQNVMILLDCGRVMGPVIEGLSRLDWSINAAMMLAHVAAIKGDKVGLMAFGEQIVAYTPPRAGRSQMLSLLRMTYNLTSASGDSDYHHAFAYFARRWTRRSLAVVFTELDDPEALRPLVSQVASLTKKHLVMVVAMADPAIVAAAACEPQDAVGAFKAAAARQIIQARKLAAAQLARAGAIVLDVPPSAFTPAVVDRYLKIKSTARL